MNETWVTVIGNVADDPRHLQTGGGVLTAFRLAHTPRNERDGIWGNGVTSFYEILCFRRLADHVAGSVVKGEPLIVHGKLQMREWQKDDRRGKDAQIVASHVGHNLAYGVSSFRRPRRDSDLVGSAPERDEFVDSADSDLEPDERADSAA